MRPHKQLHPHTHTDAGDMVRSFELPKNMRLANLDGLAKTLPGAIAQACFRPGPMLLHHCRLPRSSRQCDSHVCASWRSPLLFQVVVQTSPVMPRLDWKSPNPVTALTYSLVREQMQELGRRYLLIIWMLASRGISWPGCTRSPACQCSSRWAAAIPEPCIAKRLHTKSPKCMCGPPAQRARTQRQSANSNETACP